MNRQVSRWRSWLCSLLCAALLAGTLAPVAAAQHRKRKPVVVSFGQPNIWSLEQAHYLLQRMHMQNLDLRAKDLAEGELDPNAVNAVRISILKQLLDVGVSFDDAMRFQNELLTRNASFNSNRRLELIADRDRQQSDSLRLSREIAQLQDERTAMDADKSASDEDKKLKDAEITQKKAEQAAVEKQIAFDNDEMKTLGAQPSGTPQTPSVGQGFDANKLPSSILDKLVEKNAEKLLDLAKDPKLNASTILDNHIQMQYEIIARQLTLLRDEVGPGERLVFLELPQSVYTTPGEGDRKMAQAWWHVNGYTRTNPLLRLLLELYEVEAKWQRIQRVAAFNNPDENQRLTPVLRGASCDVYAAVAKARRDAEDDRKTRQAELDDKNNKSKKTLEAALAPPKKGEHKTPEELNAAARAQQQAVEQLENARVVTATLPPKLSVVHIGTNRQETQAVTVIDTTRKDPELMETFYEFQCEYETARGRLVQELYREERSDFARAQQGGARDTNDTVDAIRDLIHIKSHGEDTRAERHDKDVAGQLSKFVEANETQLNDEQRQQLLDELLRILSESNHQYSDGDKKYDFKKGMEFVRLDEEIGRAANTPVANIDRRTVRTVDIIPRQSSLNVNDVQETVKATGILASFKWLFGFAAQTNFQRQHEQFEQFLHQELYASGFGKGDRDFGWTFGALPGTKRVAPGVRTTYAALIVPEDAESLVVSARGCYFASKDNEPLDYEDTLHSDWARQSAFGRNNCGDDETYIIPIPGGGDAANFWVTNIDYAPVDKGSRTTVSIRGENFSSQVGVLVNGAPLMQTVGLAQPLFGVTHKDVAAVPCDKKACGELERIDPRQIVFSFSLPKDADGKDVEGTPIITLVAPGKAVDLNSLDLTVNGTRHVKLKDREYMFGARSGDPKLGISDFKVFRVNDAAAPRRAFALLTGTKFDADMDVFINGEPALAPQAGTPCASVPCKEFKSDKLFRLIFNLPLGDDVTVMIAPKDGAPVTKTFTNPLSLKINKVTVLSYEPPADKKSKGVLVVKIEGVGFDPTPGLKVEGASTRSRILDSSSTEAIVKLVDPEPSVVVTLTNAAGESTKTVVVRQPADSKLTTTSQ